MAELSEGEIPDDDNKNEKKTTEKSDFISELQNQIDQLVGENKYLKSKMKVLHEENLRIRERRESERRRYSRINEPNSSRYKHHETSLRFSRSRLEKKDSCKTRDTMLRSWSGGETSRRGSGRSRGKRQQVEKGMSLPRPSTVTPSPTTSILKYDLLGNHSQGCAGPEVSNNRSQSQAAQLAADAPPAPTQLCPTVLHPPSTVDARDVTSRERWPLKRKADSSTDVVAPTKKSDGVAAAATKNPEKGGSDEGGPSTKTTKMKITDTPPPKSTIQLRNRVRKVKKDDDAILERKVENDEEEEGYKLSFSLLGNSVMKKLSAAPRIDSARVEEEEKNETARQSCGDGKQAGRKKEKAAGSSDKDETADKKFKKSKKIRRKKIVKKAGKGAAESGKEEDATGKKKVESKERKKEDKVSKKIQDRERGDNDTKKKNEHGKKVVVFGGDDKDDKKKQGNDPQQPPIKVRFLITPTPPPSISDEGEAQKGKATISDAPQTSSVSSHLLFYRNGAMNQLLSLVFERYEQFKRKREQVSHEKRASLWTDCSKEKVICKEQPPRRRRGKNNADEKTFSVPLLDAKRRPSTESNNKQHNQQEQAFSILPTPPLFPHDNGGEVGTGEPAGVRKTNEPNVRPPLQHNADASDSCFIPEESMLRMCEPPPPMLSPFKTQDARIAPLLSKPAVTVATDDRSSGASKRPPRRRKLFSDNIS